MKKIAIIGGGVSGVVSAYYLQGLYDVTIFEKNSYLGGHTNTIEIEEGADAGTVIDTGFIVLNDKNYPNLHNFFKDINVDVRYTDMSFSFYSELDKFSYSGKTIDSFFADRKNLYSLRFYKFILEILRFSKIATCELNKGINSELSMSDFISNYRFSNDLVKNYLLPMGAAIWSTSAVGMLEFPAVALLTFFKNHGLLSLKDRPRWQTVQGGSYSYINKFKKQFKGKINLDSKVESVVQNGDKYTVNVNSGKQDYDLIICALHANRVLDVFKTLPEFQQKSFRVWQYNKNTTTLHSDLRAIAKNRKLWASWNYLESLDANDSLYTTYYMNLLMGLKTKKEYFVTLNCPFKLDEVIYSVDYEHPLFTTSSLDTQAKIKAFNGQDNLWFCGSYLGYGFHEDATSSALEVVKGLKEK